MHRMNPKFREGNLVVIAEDKSLGIISRLEKKTEGYVYYVFPAEADPLADPAEKPYRFDQLKMAPVSAWKKGVRTLTSLFDREELGFIEDLLHADLSRIALTKKIAEDLFGFLSAFVFEMELMKDEKADDAVLAYLVRIIDKLSGLIAIPSNSRSEYYIHLAKRLINSGAGKKEDWQDIKELFEKAGASGDLSAYDRLGDFYYYGSFWNKADSGKALACFRKAAAGGDIPAYCSLGLIYADMGFPQHDCRKAFECFSVAGMAGLSRGKYEAAKLILDGKIEGLTEKDAFRLVSDAYQKDLALLCDGHTMTYLPEEGLLLSKMLEGGIGADEDKIASVNVLLVSCATLDKRAGNRLFFSSLDPQLIAAVLKEKLKLYADVAEGIFAGDKIISEQGSFKKLQARADLECRIDYIAQDVSTKFAKIIFRLTKNVIPAIGADGKVRLYDKIIMRLYGTQKIKNLRSRFYLGLDYKIDYEEADGRIFIGFADPDDYGSFFLICDRLETSYQEIAYKQFERSDWLS